MYRRFYGLRQNPGNPPYPETPWLMDLKTHGIVIGKTGSGKSNYLLHIVSKLNEEDCNIVLIDPHGQVADASLSFSRKNKILLSGHDYPGSEGMYSGINVLHTTGGEENANLIGDWLRQAFSMDENLSGGTWGPRLNLIFSQVMVSLMLRERGLTLEKFAEILPDPKRLLSYFPVQEHSLIRSALLAYSGNSRMWVEFVMSSMNKLLPIVMNPLTRRVVSADDERSINLDSSILSGNFLIIPELNMGEIGVNSARAIASLLLARIWNVLMARGPSGEKTYVIIDEAHQIPEPILEILISQGRKYGVILILSYQSLSQVSPEFRETIFSNLHNYACFELSERDADSIVSNVFGSPPRVQLSQVLIKQDLHHVTVTCNSVQTARTSKGTVTKRYGPMTLRPELVENLPTRAETDMRKAKIMSDLGFREPERKSALEATTPHNRIMFKFADFLGSRGIRASIEPNVGGLIPDIRVEHEGKIIYCEVEDSDLLVTHRIAKKLKDYSGHPLMFICRDEDFSKLVSIIRTITGNARNGEFYQAEDERIPVTSLPEALLQTSIITYRDDQFYFFNGTDRVKFSTIHFQKDSSFISRARKLSMGNFRAEVLREIVISVKESGKIDLDQLESHHGRDKLRELLKRIKERGYSEGLTFNSLLELDRTGNSEDSERESIDMKQ